LLIDPKPATALALVDRLSGSVKEVAAKAVGHVLRPFGAVPSAWLHGVAQNAKTKSEVWFASSSEARTDMENRVLSAEDFIDRATAGIFGEIYDKYKNKEVIAIGALERLSPQTSDPASPPGEREVDEDWLNLFSSYAQNASSDRLRQIWSMVLAAEIRTPGAFSLPTLGVISRLDKSTSEAFQRIAGGVFDDFIPRSPLRPENVGVNLMLEEAGLIAGSAGTLSKKTVQDTQGRAHLVGRSIVLRINGDPGQDYQVQCFVLTKAGMEMAQLLDPPDDTKNARSVVEAIHPTKPASIDIARIISRTGEEAVPGPFVQFWVRDAGSPSREGLAAAR
jgi:hypothetical protein